MGSDNGMIQLSFKFNERYSIINYQANFFTQLLKLGSYLSIMYTGYSFLKILLARKYKNKLGAAVKEEDIRQGRLARGQEKQKTFL